jgi:hypothetical protein
MGATANKKDTAEPPHDQDADKTKEEISGNAYI